MQARTDAAAAALIEPEPTAAGPAALSEAMAEFEALARAAQAASAPAATEQPSVASAPYASAPASTPEAPAPSIDSLFSQAPAAPAEPTPFQWGPPAQQTPPQTPPPLIEPAPAASAFESARPVEPAPVESEPRKAQWPFGITAPIEPEQASEAPAAEQPTPEPAPAAPQPAASAPTDPFNFLGINASTSEPVSASAPPSVSDAPASVFPFATPVAAEPFAVPAPADEQQDSLTPNFVEPPATSSYEPPAGHWSRQADLDDETQPFENTLSREVGGGNVATTTSALILPMIPQHTDFSNPLGTGEILVTGTIDLPQSFGTMGGDSRRYDDPDVDHLYDAYDEVVSTESAPVRATRAVSTHTSTHGVIHQNKPGTNRMLTVLIVTASVLAVGVIGLLIAGVFLK